MCAVKTVSKYSTHMDSAILVKVFESKVSYVGINNRSKK